MLCDGLQKAVEEPFKSFGALGVLAMKPGTVVAIRVPYSAMHCEEVLPALAAVGEASGDATTFCVSG